MGTFDKNQLEDSRARLTRRQTIIILSVIGAGGLLLRLSHVHAEIPIIGSGDAYLYFQYAVDVARLDSLHVDSTLQNNGWPVFLSFFFQFIDSNNYLDYMLVQKLVGVALSVLTIIPVYMICKRFFPEKFALIGPVIFVFEPTVVANSFLGLTEPLFVFLISTVLACFLNSQKRVVFFTFPLLALASVVRGEAVLMMIPFTLLYIVRFRHSRKTVYEIPLLVMIMLLILAPIAAYRIDALGTDAMFIRTWDIVSLQIDKAFTIGGDVEIQQDSNSNTILQELIKMIRFAHLLFIPLIFLVPYGLYRIFKLEMKYVSVITILFFMLIVSINALAVVGTVDTKRYLFWTIPTLCILCTFSVEKLSGFFSNKNLVLVAIMGLIIAYAVINLENERINVEYKKDGYQIDRIVLEKTGKNVWHTIEAHYMPESTRVNTNEYSVINIEGDPRGEYVQYCTRKYPSACSQIVEYVDVIAEFLKEPRHKKFTHMTVDDVEKRKSDFLIHVFQNEEQYPYLTKIYDSKDDGFEYHVKVFEINYEKLITIYPG